MKSAKSSGKLKKLNNRHFPLFIRRVQGESMQPVLRPGQLVVARGFWLSLKPGDVVVIEHEGLEKIKRLDKIADSKVYVLGDNPSSSLDSRSFGWLGKSQIVGKVVWPRI